ncbi:DNA translocase FtsK 4TM domain-containing protein [Gudongella oleilytica]|jgi:S-DNA-T family DNA segregation ATPase FtsK/SpoIIIE|uniref:FtsK/SpoIIIE family DNA translocase n=1 Tax=Gudongella oleilytica TaxID=1582259 RepID=UPI002A35FCE0|nr:DNA translocase FtsK 4TM domain-containing protein [Gudongella oleilytica]MDY0255798.1 DNA translocase FtsK 4TM domain-containing protein [Gudongella oleilytica]HMM68934.1 DNA translocase FtsK 4TM domain-containing protein [Gudongella oleilytica]
MRKNAKPIDNNIKTKKATVDKLGLDIIGILVIGVGVVMLFSLFSLKMGIIGEIINGTTFSLMGFGGYFFPLFIIGSGIILLMERFDRIQLRILVALIIIFLSFLIVLDGINMDSSSLIDRIKSGLELSRANRGGGVLGSFFGFFFYKLFGSVGTYVVLAFSITASLLIITNLTVKEVLGKARSIKVIKPVEQVKETAAKKQAPVNPDRFLEEKTEVIRISDYTKNQQHPDGIEKEKKESLPKIPKDQLVKEAQTIDSEIKEKQEKVVKIYYKTPPISLLQSPAPKAEGNNRKDILNNARIIEETMRNFGIEATVSHINVGPTITCYELSPAPGIKLSRIVSLSDNISLSLASSDIRIEAPIPGKAAVGIEVPNKTKDMVLFKELIQSKEFADSKSDIPLVLGKDITGNVVISTIDKMPHLLIAGATGSGKSVCINTIIMGLLYKSSPEDLKMLLIDPKVVELSVYNGIPHLLIPVVTDAKKSAFALNWAVGEMERRYKLFAKSNVRDIQSYNEKHSTDGDKLPKILIIIDELADLMMVAAQEIEDYIARLAQMARAAGMYLIVATQRPSVDVITGTIKANIPSRISFAVSSQVDSRTILDMAGAEKLLGQGDMLFYPSSYSKPVRLQGAFISNNEVEKVVEYLQEQNMPNYDENILDVVQNTKQVSYDEGDDLLPEAIKLVVAEGVASISLLQRKLKIGYARAARLIDDMEERGVVGGYEGSKPRKVLITETELEEWETADE